MTFAFGLHATLGAWWSTMMVLVPSQHGHLFHTFVSGFPHIVTSSLLFVISQSFPLQANIGEWPSKCSNTGKISRRTSSMYSPLFNPQNPTLNVLKHLPRNSIIHGLNTNRRVFVFFVTRMLGFGLGCDNKDVSRRVPCTLNTNNLVGV